jgi:zinc protease
MKRLISLIISLIPLICIAQGSDSYIITGKTNTPATITVQYMIDGKPIKNSVEVADGAFKLKGAIANKVAASFLVVPKEQGTTATIRRFWIEPGYIKVSGLDSKGMTVFSGTPLNDESNELAKEELPLKNMPAGKQQNSARKVIVINFIKAHPNSLLSLTELNYTLSNGIPDINLAEPLFNSLSADVKASPMGLEYQQKLAKWKSVEVGAIAPDFTQPDKDGKPVKLSDFKGKYIFIDFWASWCHPCRDENPNLIKQYHLYRDKNFIILSVSLDGPNVGARAEWLKAIKEDHVGEWPQLSELTGAKKNKAVLKYGVGSIPESFLIDPKGIIIGKSLRGDELNNKLKEIFSGDNLLQKTIDIADDQFLPLDTAVKTGKLANGFTYYIRRNTTPKNRVTLYLANKAGSILENENQRGLAHLMEHMNFDGTTHFPKYELINYLQKSGVRFGADLNAYTSFDETVYQLPLPSDDPEILKNGLQIMRDWAQSALLDSAEMMRERSVVLEEKRIGKGAGERMNRKYLPVLLNGSRYAERVPIGLDTVLDNFKPGTLREFYHDWYRPDLQALIVVGDINVDQMEKTIKEKFSDLRNPVDERERPKYSVQLSGKNQFAIITDKDKTRTILQVLIKHKSDELKTADDYRKYITKGLFNSMLSERLGDLSANKSDPPFTNASAGIGDILGGLDAFSVECVAKPGEMQRGFKAVWLEIERIERFGFTQTELDRAKASFLTQKESSMADLKTTDNNYFVREYLQYFLKGIASPGLSSEVEMTKAFLPVITLESMKKLVDEYIQMDNRDIVVMAPEKDILTLPDEQKVEQWMADVANEKITSYKDSFSEKKIYSKKPVPGKIVNERKLESIDATEWTLSNGSKVILKKTNFSANTILFRAFAPGGSSSYNDRDFESARMAPYISFKSGICNYRYGDFIKFVSGKEMLVFNASIENYMTKFQGDASIKDMETYLQILHAQFTQPRFDQESFNGFINSEKISISNSSHDPKDIFSDTVQAIISNHSIRSAKYTTATLSDVDLEKCEKIYNDWIRGNVSNFTFIFSGPLDMEKMRPLVEKYIGSLPAADNHRHLKDLAIHPPAGKIIKTLYLGTEPKSTVSLTFSGSYNYNPESNKTLKALTEVIQISLLQRLREKENGAYSPSARISFEKIPEQRYRLRIGFDCAPENVEKLVAAALEEVNKIKISGPDTESLEKFKAEDRRNNELNWKQDFTWVEYIQNQILNHEDLNEVNNYKKILEKVTRESVQRAANQYLRDDNLIQLILKPEASKP